MCDLKKINYPKSLEYRSGTYYEPILFFIDAFSESKSLDLLLGYFSSTALSVLAVGFTKFLANGGKMRIVINNVLSTPDKEALIVGGSDNINELSLLKYNFDRIVKMLEESGKHTLECFAWLLANKKIEIVAVKPKDGKGISHYKSGIFSDGANKISFKGSCNFSAQAMLENLEELGVKKEWNSESEQVAIKEHEGYFEHIFSGSSDNVEYVSFSEIEERIIEQFGGKDINSLFEQEKLLIQKKYERLNANPILSSRLEDLIKEIKNIQQKPCFPYSSGPRDYQEQAYESWVKNGKKGIFAMATGTGKTITSLNCLLQEYNETGFYQALILVPTNDLQKQWVKELAKFNISESIVVGVDAQWKRKMSKLTTALDFGTKRSFVVISTYVSFTKHALQHFIKYFPKESLIIADEAHNIASPSVKKLLPDIYFEKRIGLSATPKRIYDAEGTDEMNIFFNDKPPYTYEYSMEEAIAKGILCKYDYFPHIISLTSDELVEYKKITLQLMQFFDAETGSFKNAEVATSLLMKRKRIIHKAENKLPAFRSIMNNEFKKRGNLTYTFVYVPEGLDNNSEEDDRIIGQYNHAVMNISKTIRISSFTGESKDRSSVLESFENARIDVLTAMKCLDEGVDIPRTELAIFCSSTANPRQFIQRRGRILRQHDDKTHAVIHDLVVIPRMDLSTEKSETFSMERSQVENELKRVADFAFMSRNQFDALAGIEEICKYYELDIFSIKENMK